MYSKQHQALDERFQILHFGSYILLYCITITCYYQKEDKHVYTIIIHTQKRLNDDYFSYRIILSILIE